MKKALIVWGGWDGHEPEKVSAIFADILRESGCAVEISSTLDPFTDRARLKELDLIVPLWTMGKLPDGAEENVIEAVADGVGLAGCHGGMCDAFRESVGWQFMTGGNWVSHPGGDGMEYLVQIVNKPDSILRGIQDFKVTSEHYYLHVDPANNVLATTRFPLAPWYHSPNGEVDMPLAWTKLWGAGRVFYTALGHHADVFEVAGAREMLRRGLVWALESKELARVNGLCAESFKSDKKMF